MDHLNDDVPVVLVSNSSLKIYPENTISNFKNSLHTAIELSNDSDWFVAVSEFSYTKSWCQLPEDQEISIVRQYVRQVKTDSQEYENTKQIETRQLPSLKSQQFDTIWQLTKAINQIFVAQSASCLLSLLENGNGVRVETTVTTSAVTGDQFFDIPLFSEELTYFLGLHLTYATLFNSAVDVNVIYSQEEATSNDLELYLLKRRKDKHGKFVNSRPHNFKLRSKSNPIGHQQDRLKRSFATNKSKTLYSDLFGNNVQTAKSVVSFKTFPIIGQPIDIMNGSHSLFVYCDVCQTSRVGDSLTQLLTIIDVPMRARYGEQIYRRFEVPQFQRVSRNYITEIEIDIRDDTGAAVPFQFGRVIMKLIFRRFKRAVPPSPLSVDD